LAQIGRRSEAEALLAGGVANAAIRAYLLQNLDRGPDGHWRWRLNLAALRAHIADIMDFPEPPPGARYDGPTRFVYGGDSDYLQPEHAEVIRRWFPNATSTGIPNAGHWVYADRPSAFAGVLRGFLGGPRA
jgi:pimeloyl-ACP methyl ester carboxylesterase